MFIANSGASLHTMRESSLTSQMHTASGIVRSANVAKIYIQELGTYLHVKLVEDSPSVLSVMTWVTLAHGKCWNPCQNG